MNWFSFFISWFFIYYYLNLLVCIWIVLLMAFHFLFWLSFSWHWFFLLPYKVIIGYLHSPKAFWCLWSCEHFSACMFALRSDPIFPVRISKGLIQFLLTFLILKLIIDSLERLFINWRKYSLSWAKRTCILVNSPKWFFISFILKFSPCSDLLELTLSKLHCSFYRKFWFISQRWKNYNAYLI